MRSTLQVNHSDCQSSDSGHLAGVCEWCHSTLTLCVTEIRHLTVFCILVIRLGDVEIFKLKITCCDHQSLQVLS